MKTIKKLLLAFFIAIFGLTVAAMSIYWFELDTLLIKKLEPVFRHFANEI
ncbi:MAG: hypothetical protein RR214_03865 [Synergistaceae bacterium]